jgi:hypothetical protein
MRRLLVTIVLTFVNMRVMVLAVNCEITGLAPPDGGAADPTG